MAVRVVGKLMPKPTPEATPNERTIVKIDPATMPFGYVAGTLTPGLVKRITLMAEQEGEVGPLYEVYEQMEIKDAMYAGIVDQVKSAVAGSTFKVIPAQATNPAEQLLADEYAEVVREMMVNLPVRQITRAFTDAHFIGAKLYLTEWEMMQYGEGGAVSKQRNIWLPKTVKPVRGRHLNEIRNNQSPYDGQLAIRTTDRPDGVPVASLPDESYILITKDDAEGKHSMLGAARRVLSWYLGIQYVLAWWVQYIEGYAAPQRIAKYPTGTGAETKAEMEHFLQVLGQHGYALFPNDMELTLLEANRQGTITTYQDFVRMGYEQYAISILGQAATTGTKGTAAPYAGGVVANSIRFETLQEVGAIAAGGWETLAGHTIRVNYGAKADKRLFPTIRPVIVTPQELTAKASAFQTLQSLGIPVEVAYAYEQILGVEPPRRGQLVVSFGKEWRYGVDTPPEPPQPATGPAGGAGGTQSEKAPGSRSVAEGTAERSRKQQESE